MDIAIIGGGPIGCYAGHLLARSGHKVSIYENHAQIGSPIQCTGILTSDFDKFGFSLEPFLINIIDQIKVISPNHSTVIKQQDYIICRSNFDQYFARLAQEEGAEIFLNHSFTDKEGKSLIIKDSKNNIIKRIQPEIVIAADGPLSPTAKAYGFYHPKRESYHGIQATVQGDFNPGKIITYFGNDICPGLFAWITPESADTARVGLATKRKSKYYFDKFMQQHNFKALEIQAGTIPIYHPKQKLQHGNCYLVGDASSYVKATTLGGIVPAMEQVQALVRAINNNTDYKDELSATTRKMQIHLKVNKIMNKFSDQDWDKLISYVNQKKIRKIFEKYTRDNPIPLITKTLLKEPRFLYFVKYLL